MTDNKGRDMKTSELILSRLSATPEEVESLRREADAMRAELATLELLLSLVSAAPRKEESPKPLPSLGMKVAPRPKKQREVPAGMSKQPSDSTIKVAWLLQHGPLTGKQLADRMKLDPRGVGGIIGNCPSLFSRDIDGYVHLTAAGREVANGHKPDEVANSEHVTNGTPV